MRALSATDASSKAVTSETQEAICAYVDELKAQQLPPERVLVQIKELIATVEGDWSSDEQRQFLQQVILWCIQAYYRT
jgi:hypothetical protein